MTAYYNENDHKAASWLRKLISNGLIENGVVDERSITEVQPDEVRGFDRVHLFAGIGGWALALQMAGWPAYEPIWTGSCPCFTAGTLVLSGRGLIPIEKINPGDLVWTHRNRWRKVIDVGSCFGEVGRLSGHGHPGIYCTPLHPFLSCTRTISVTKKDGRNFRKHAISSANWESAYDMGGKWWAMPLRYDESITPVAESLTPEQIGFLAGFYVGDGWLGKGSREGSVIFGLNPQKAAELMSLIPNLPWRQSKQRTTIRLEFSNHSIAGILRDGFGEYSHLKTLPNWMLGADPAVKEAFVRGWDLTDGTRKPHSGVSRITTTSRSLAMAGRMLLVSMGFSVSVRKVETNRTANIDGRLVSQRDYYTINRSNNDRYKFYTKDHAWFSAKNFLSSKILQRVFNICVDEDNSYTADGIVVHNCQPFSAAGKRKGTYDARHLWPEMHRLVAACKPPVVLGEQVASKAGRAWLAGVFAQVEALGYRRAGADLCAACIGAPHIRQRLWWVADAQHPVGRPKHEVDGQTPGRDRSGGGGAIGGLGLAECDLGRSGCDESQRESQGRATDRRLGAWDIFRLVHCADGKTRRIEPSITPLAHGLPARMVRLRGYGNAIVPQLAAEFIMAYRECR